MRVPRLFHYQMYDTRLAAELLVLGTRGIHPQVALMLATALAALSLRVVPWTVAAAWLTGAAAVCVFGFHFRRRHALLTPAEVQRPALQRAEWLGVVYSCCVGTLWGCSGLLMAPGAHNHNLLMFASFLGFSAAASSAALFGPAHLIVGGATATSLFALLALPVFPDIWPWLAILLALYQYSLLRSSWTRHDIIVDNLRLRDEKQLLLEQQRAETDRANQANQEKSAFLAAASHDLRQPLHALMLTSHALSLRTPEGASRALVQRILEAGDALSQQFNHLMDLSRLESGTYRLNRSLLAPQALLQQAIAAHRQIAEHRHIRLRLRGDPLLQQLALHTDASLLGRILDNLLDNAIKFSSAGGQVLLSARLSRHHLRISVHDRGIGIPAAQAAHIFKPYVQLNNPTRDLNQGIGLGLSIVHQAAQLLGGHLRLRSRVARGSSFSLLLPRTIAQPVVTPPRPAGDAAPLRADLAQRLRGLRLLLVEDDGMAATALTTWLTGWGMQVQHHADPREVPTNLQPALIISDIRLPGDRDGIHWLTQWLGQWPDARGLLLSGEVSADTHQRAEQEGLLLLFKPASPELLLQTLAGMAPTLEG